MIPADFSVDRVRKFCSDVVKCEMPAPIRTEPMQGEEERNCFFTVEKQVASQGGERVIGWAIWELPGVFMEAEFHAVWRSPTGELVDITPRPLSFGQISFACDTNRKYNGLQVDNIRKPLVADMDVIQLLALYRERFGVWNAGKRAYQYGSDVQWSRAERAQLMLIADDIAQLEERVARRYLKSEGRP